METEKWLLEVEFLQDYNEVVEGASSKKKIIKHYPVGMFKRYPETDPSVQWLIESGMAKLNRKLPQFAHREGSEDRQLHPVDMKATGDFQPGVKHYRGGKLVKTESLKSKK
jgi:hypothetical protein